MLQNRRTIPDHATCSPGQCLSPCAAGLAVVVLQSGDVIVPSGAPATLDCSMAAGFSMSSYTMLWYRQDQAGAPLEFLATEYDGRQGRLQVSIQATKNLFSLGITEPLVNDSSRYYCAARHSEAQRLCPHSNNNTTA